VVSRKREKQISEPSGRNEGSINILLEIALVKLKLEIR
jgi:hypothetical protein